MVPIYYWILLFVWVNTFMLNRLLTKRGRGVIAEKSIMIIFGSGGHTTEMLLMLESLNV